ncbi:helix-turn-helix domain-containing protein [Glaciecola siphonariae]|uniref:Helix-turn-helix domain-containing protein n=1 Tax=Glaciecola siphonariae TaxID=521012 RepID=A0ABV9LWJ2_9ALTE
MEVRGDIVKTMRLEKGWTQAQLAEICDVNLRTIQRVENNGSASLETIMSLCVTFDVKRQALFKVPSPEELALAQKDELQTSALSIRAQLLIFIGGVTFGSAITIVTVLALLQ